METIIRHLLLILLCFFMARNADAQVVAKPDTTKKAHDVTVAPKVKGPPPIRHEISGGFRLNTDGWGIYADLGKVKTKDIRHSDMFHNVRVIQIEFTEKKDPREYKSTSTLGSGNNNYIYGKINNFYALKLGWGIRRQIAGKPDPGSVSIHWATSGGFALGVMKPYYLNTVSDPSAIKYKDNQSDFLDQNVIEGSAGFTKGIGEVTIVPGAHFKSALHFDFASSRKMVLAVEAGFNAEYYTQQVQIMANESGTNYFLDLFIAAQFGKRY